MRGKSGFFRLSPLGEQILKDAGLRHPWFEASVVDESEKGIFIRLLEEVEPVDRPGNLVLFLKWEYVATAGVIWKG